MITNPSVDLAANDGLILEENGEICPTPNERKLGLLLEENGTVELLSTSRESLVCPASPLSNSSNGGIYSVSFNLSVLMYLLNWIFSFHLVAIKIFT